MRDYLILGLIIISTSFKCFYMKTSQPKIYHRNYTNAVEEPDEYIEIYRK